MKMQSFLILLNGELKKDFPELDFGFYVSRRNRYVHMGSDVALHRIPNYQKIIDKIKLLWYQKKRTTNLYFVSPI